MQKPSAFALRLLGFDVELHQRGREAMFEEPGQAADRAGLALEVEHHHVAFGRRVEFKDQRNPKAGLELLPDIGTQSVAAGEPQLVFGLVRVAAAR